MFRSGYNFISQSLMCLLTLAQAASSNATSVRVPPPHVPMDGTSIVKPLLLRDDPLLQEKVTLEATNRPLGDCLAELSPKLKVDLSVAAQIADQRVTIHITNQPLYLVMNRLPTLLSHLPDHPHGYYWEKLDRSAKARPAFNLWRDLRSVQDEEYERDYPRREAGVLLRDLRNLSRLTPQERLQYKGEYPYLRFPGISPTEDGPEGAALKGLTDEQIESLLSGEKIALDPAMFAKEVVAFRRKQRTDRDRIFAAAISAGYPAPEPPDVLPAISVVRMDEDGEYPDQVTKYGLHLEGINAYETILDVYDTNAERAPDRVLRPATEPNEPVFDLSPLLWGKSVTSAQREDVGFTLQALAKVAHVNLYQEDFFSRGATWKSDSPGLATLKGTLPQLVAAICAEWDYHVEKIGDDYVFWSRTWAQSRSTDVPDRLLVKWRARLQKQGVLTLEDNAEIAATLTWPQVKLTLDAALPEAGLWNSVKTYKTLHLMGLLPPLERDAAFSADGLALTSLPPWTQQAFAADFRQDFARIPGNQLNQAVLTFQTTQAGSSDAPTEVVRMNVSAGGQSLLGTVLAIKLLPPPAASPPIPSPSAASPPVASPPVAPHP